MWVFCYLFWLFGHLLQGIIYVVCKLKLFMDILWDLSFYSVFGDKIDKAFEQILQ